MRAQGWCRLMVMVQAGWYSRACPTNNAPWPRPQGTCERAACFLVRAASDVAANYAPETKREWSVCENKGHHRSRSAPQMTPSLGTAERVYEGGHGVEATLSGSSAGYEIMVGIRRLFIVMAARGELMIEGAPFSCTTFAESAELGGGRHTHNSTPGTAVDIHRCFSDFISSSPPPSPPFSQPPRRLLGWPVWKGGADDCTFHFTLVRGPLSGPLPTRMPRRREGPLPAPRFLGH